MKDFLRQNGILLLVAAVLLSVALWLGSALFGGTDPVRNLAGAVATPFRGGVTAVLDWFGTYFLGSSGSPGALSRVTRKMNTRLC